MPCCAIRASSVNNRQPVLLKLKMSRRYDNTLWVWVVSLDARQSLRTVVRPARGARALRGLGQTCTTSRNIIDVAATGNNCECQFGRQPHSDQFAAVALGRRAIPAV